ncbi:hypothetical protein J0H58_26510 [bacterium]|nr:hypothetical protein [bacterium]
MAQMSLGEGKWRMLRRVLKKRAFQYADCRNQARHDQEHFDWLLEHGFFAANGDDTFAITPAGRGAAELGLYDGEPAGR